MRTAESVVFTDWPPGPEERKTSTLSSDSGISMWSVVSMRGDDLDRGEGRLAATLVIEGADAHEAVGAGLDGERAVGVGRLDLEGRRLQAASSA